MKKGFTLAEVLITLGIIGIVCTLTLPTLIAKHQKQVTITKLKKIYSVISQQVLLSNSNNYPANEFLTAGDNVNASKTEEFFNTYWLPYFKGATILNKPYNTEYPYKSINGQSYKTQIKTIFSAGRIVFSTSDGFIIFISTMYWGNNDGDTVSNPKYSTEMTILVDTNGTQSPNTLGKDVFRVTINYDKNNVMPYKINDSSDNIDKDCSKTGKGETCFAKIVKDGWRISDDYPW